MEAHSWNKWKKVKLVEVAQSIKAGGTPKRTVDEYWKNGNIPWLKISDLKSTYIISSEEKVTEEGLNNSSAKLFPEGTILYSIFATLGAIGILNFESATNQAIAGIIPNNEIVDTKYLYYCLISEKKNIVAKKSRATQDNINLKILKNHEIPLPPLKTQQKIVEVLEKAEKLKEYRAEADVLTDEYLKSVFLEMFGDPANNPKKWPLKKFKDLMVGTPQNGLYKNSSYYTEGEDGLPILRIDSFYDGKIENIQNLKRIICTNEEINRFKLKNQNIVINRVNSIEYLGKCALVEDLLEETVYESNMMQIELNLSLINPVYLTKFLCTNYVHNQIINKAKKAVNQASINQKDVNSLNILLPPIALQNQFAEIVKKVEQLKKHQKQSKQEIDNLFNALMQKAFKGELTC
ncbi:restriction endonuclease subunit S [Methanobacterium congolense]|uniref:Type-1 restriction enzyme MjaXIP specificity protein n=1 Tax=Methanobacterium congolense TaxID=118062 RepID=A0A1D3L1D5_9EURY|nr:restriction endonuclease subunit S [Methanobacterium congolense]SCG85309.1 Type-1 restriction enzyme MjaXIP specificity protein [Methanobacterium congolense]